MQTPTRSLALVAATFTSVLATGSVATVASAATTAATKQAAEAGVNWITAQQDPATGKIDPLDGLSTDFVFSAVAAAGRNAADVQTGGIGNPTLQDAAVARYGAAALAEAVDPATGANPTGYGADHYIKALLAAPAAGLDPQRITADQNLVAQLVATYQPASGSFKNSLQAIFATIALARAGAPEELVDRTVDYLKTQQHDDGGWNYATVTTPADRAADGEADSTASAVAALCEAGEPVGSAAVRRGLEHLRGRLLQSGGIDTRFGASFPANTDTQAWTISALHSCGIDPQSARWTSSAGNSLVDFLLSKQVTNVGSPDFGAFTTPGWPVGSPEAVSFYSTQDAVRALAGEGFSATAPARAGSGPVKRPVAAPPAGTVTPHALVVDAGGGDVRACRVAAPVDATIAAFLAAAPAACKAGTEGGAWTVQLDHDPVAPMGAQTVPFGDTVTLRRVRPVEGPKGDAGAAGAKGEAGAKGDAGAAGETGARGETGAKGDQGATGAAGPVGPAGKEGKAANVTCTVKTTKGKPSSITCKVPKLKGATKARLTRGGRTYAAGTLRRLSVTRSLPATATYTLRLRDGGRTFALTLKR